MAYIAPIHKPSIVKHAISLSFLSPDNQDLIVAKSNYLEIWSPNPSVPEQLVLQYTRPLYGKITLLHKLRPADSATDHLFVSTDRHHYFIVSWDADRKQLRTEKSYVDIGEKASRASQTGNRIHIDPNNRFLTLECYEGIVHVLPIAQDAKGKRRAMDNKIGELGEPILVRIPELFIRSTCFLHKRLPCSQPSNPLFAILSEDSQQRLSITIRELEYHPSLRPQEEPATAELERFQFSGEGVEAGAIFLVPVPPPVYGFLVIGETNIGYVNELERRIGHVKPLDEATIFVSWCAIDELRYVLADDYGRLYLLYILTDADGNYHDHQLDDLGNTSRASSLVHLGDGRVFVGSNQGNSQVVQIVPNGLEVIQEISNIAPILDFTVMDMGNRAAESVVNEFSSGQARIVTGSGAFNDGSLRSVRSGVGLEDQGLIDVMGAQVTAMFGLRSEASNRMDTLLVSFVDQTRIFSFNSKGEVEELDHYNDFDLAQETLFASQIDDGRSLQITKSSVLVSNATDKQVWKPTASLSISAADANGSLILLSLQGDVLVVLDVSGNTIKTTAERTFDNEQVSCFTLAQAIPNTCIVGFWRGDRISLLDLQSLQTIASEIVSADQTVVVPRSLKVASVLSGNPTLFVGMADGHVITYTINTNPIAFHGKKRMVLGTQAPNFTMLSREDGTHNIFANCEHPSLIYGSEGRVVYSAVTADKVTSVCSFDCERCPNAIAIASSETGELRLAIVDEQRTTHVETLPVYETVRRIAYSPQFKAFGMGTIKRTLKAGAEQVFSEFKLVDEVVFKELDSFALNDEELIECVIRSELPDGNNTSSERFLVGTAFFEDDGKDDVRGRLLIFDVTADRKLRLVLQRDLRSACRCLAVGQDRIVAALVKTVVAYSLEYDTPSHAYLEKHAIYRTSTAPVDIIMNDSVIAVTDLMKSLTLIQLERGQSGSDDKLTEIARHFQTVWGTAVAKVADNTYLQSDAEGNLIVLQHEINGYSAEDRQRLRVTSEMKLGEFVNRIRRVDVQPSAGAIIIPRAFVATVDGSIHLFALIAPGKVDLLMRMQTKMAALVKAPGNIPFSKFRGFKTEVRDMTDEGPVRFVDGTLIEQFLDCEDQLQNEISADLKVSVEELQTMVETLKRTH